MLVVSDAVVRSAKVGSKHQCWYVIRRADAGCE